MPIKNYTTKVPAVQTVGEIQGILAAHGARKVMMDYAENGKVTAVTFALDCCGSLHGFRLEARPDGVKAVMAKERTKCDDEQAERIEGAFKSEKDRVQAMVETAMKRVTGLAGQWSVDILMDEGDNLWLIDMAIAQRSAYWEKRPEGYAE